MRDILEILFKRLKAILLILVVCVGTTLVGNYILTAQFESEAKLLISVGREGALPTTVMTQPLNVFLERKDQVNTQMQLLKTRFLVEETLKNLPEGWEELNMTPSNSLFSKVKGVVKDVGKSIVGGLKWVLETTGLIPTLTPEQHEILALLDRIDIERMKNTDVLRISFRHPNPFAAQAFLQAYLKTYMITDIRTSNSNTAMEFFTSQVESSLTELRRAEAELSRFRNQANIYDLTEQKKNTSQEMASLYTQITENNLQMDGLEQDIVKYRKTSGEQIEAGISTPLRSDPIILETLKILVSSKMRLTKELKNMGENNPKIISLRAELGGIRASLKEEVLSTMKSRILSLQDENGDLNRQLAALKQRAQELDEQGINMEQLQRKVDLLRQSYMTYSEKQETSRINTMLDRSEINSVTVTQPPTMPIKPVSPKRMLNLILGILAGFVFGFFYAMLMEMVGATVNSPEEMSRILGSKSQIFLPYDPIEDPRKEMPARFKNALQLLASMSLRTKATPPRILMFVGAGQGVGTTTVCLMFARFLAERLGQKTLIADANYADRNLSKTFGADSKPGLTDILAGETDVATTASTFSGTLDLLPAGQESLLPATLLSISRNMRGDMEKLLESYDLILLDASPLSGPESFNLAKVVDGVIVVAQSEKTRREVLRVTKEQLSQVDANLAGSVLNQRKFHIPSWLYRYL